MRQISTLAGIITLEDIRELKLSVAVELTPGIYKVYAEPWGKKTNIVNFEITK